MYVNFKTRSFYPTRRRSRLLCSPCIYEGVVATLACNSMQVKHKCISCPCIQSGCHPIKLVTPNLAHMTCMSKEGYKLQGAHYLSCPLTLCRHNTTPLVARAKRFAERGPEKNDKRQRCSKAEIKSYSRQKRRMIDQRKGKHGNCRRQKSL